MGRLDVVAVQRRKEKCEGKNERKRNRSLTLLTNLAPESSNSKFRTNIASTALNSNVAVEIRQPSPSVTLPQQ